MSDETPDVIAEQRRATEIAITMAEYQRRRAGIIVGAMSEAWAADVAGHADTVWQMRQDAAQAAHDSARMTRVIGELERGLEGMTSHAREMEESATRWQRIAKMRADMMDAAARRHSNKSGLCTECGQKYPCATTVALATVDSPIGEG